MIRFARCVRAFVISLVIAAGWMAGAQAQPQGSGGGMVVAANPHAVEAGVAVLERGGSAIDAAVAVQVVLGLVEPQSSGIGGGAVALYWDADENRLYAYDGREVAPASATPDLFIGEDGKPLGFREAVLGGKSVGVPGVVAMLDMMHKAHGKLAWKTLFDYGIGLADGGFAVSPRLHGLLARFKPLTYSMPDTAGYLYTDEGEPLAVGFSLVNAEYAETLRRIAAYGARKGFYEGPVAEAIVAAVQNAPRNPTEMTLEDLARYQPKVREALCVPYRGRSVCGMPPPSAGGVTVGQVLSFLEPFNLAAMGPGSLEAVHLITEAQRLAYADRYQHLADTDFVDVPLQGLLDPDYLRSRGQLIDPAKSMGIAKPGTPPAESDRTDRAPDVSPTYPGTSHFSIIDADGNVLSMTTTIEFAFGSHLMAGGFLLNNQLTDFSYEPTRDGKPIANAVAAGKRPLSSMSPTIVFDGAGKPEIAIGSPGGTRIPPYVIKTLIGVMDWGLSMQEAIEAPHYLNRNGATQLEQGTDVAELQAGLEALGHEVRVSGINSGLHGFRITAQGLDGGADPRREGVVGVPGQTPAR